jgi:hypothetical protein
MKTTNYIKKGLFIVASICLFWGCTKEGDNFDYEKDVILVTGTETTPLVQFKVEDTPSSYIVTSSATDKVSEDVHITYEIKNSLIDEYNKKYNTSYFAAPTTAVEMSDSEDIIESGKASSSGISIAIVSTEDFITGRTYVIPVTIKSVKGGNMEVLSASKTIFLKISRVINFNSLDMSNYSLYGSYIAPDEKVVDLPNYTFEIKCFINNWHEYPSQISRLCNFGPKDESVTNLLRFGENGQEINSLQWVSPGGGLISSTLFNTEKWYNIAITFDGSTYTMYLDGVKDAELSGSTGTTFQRMELGMSWTGYPAQQYFDGRIAEIRLWNRALTTSELKIGLCSVDPESEGLIAYWKLNEGEGYIFKDATQSGYDMDWSSVWREVNSGAGIVEQDHSGYVNWIIDDKNKCSQ